ncbi:hypothetical protein SAMN02927916_2298 [Flavobacterium anhuiense]|uniref:Lipoprotein n=2 Tax=Flavobacterium anhuiense TaxID=459526 RepID=A0ABY0LQ72_9FLAO|nr:hypothetical protein SAMN02927916_2298 [Flavobacterium anhuiense]
MLNHLKATIMDISKYISLLLFCFLLNSCHKTKYVKDNSSFWGIYLKEWNSSKCPKKIVYQSYVKDSKFKILIKSDSVFNIGGCENNSQRIFTPNVFYRGKINYDIRLIIDDSLEYRITGVENKIDTVFYCCESLTIMNNISSLVINGQNIDNKNAPLNIEIPTNLGKIIKK